MISWVNKKTLNIDTINNKILNCIETKHFTNEGINVIKLQNKIKELFKLDDNKEVLMTCNGAMGINSLIGGLNIYFNKKLNWAVQSFTFPCSKQGLLVDSIVFDIDENMGPNIEELNKRKDDFDGVLITNCFGCSVNIKIYEEFCKNNNKLLLFDNAASSMTFYEGKNHLNYGNGCMVSLHHTKPIGFGEGGFIVFDKEYLNAMKKTICFGFTNTDRLNYDIYASNYKMSEIACIYINEYLNNLEKIYNHHTEMINYFIEKLKKNNLETKIKIFKNFSNYFYSLMSTIPLIFENNIDTIYFIDNNIEAKKYYYPLDKTCNNSVNIFNKIICLPLNMDINKEVIDFYIDILNKNNS
jgi:dTDP-4-amino-4,6-dideoxygalactose transaminase